MIIAAKREQSRKINPKTKEISERTGKPLRSISDSLDVAETAAIIIPKIIPTSRVVYSAF